MSQRPRRRAAVRAMQYMRPQIEEINFMQATTMNYNPITGRRVMLPIDIEFDQYEYDLTMAPSLFILENKKKKIKLYR